MKTKIIKQKTADDQFTTYPIGADASNVDVQYRDPETQAVSTVNGLIYNDKGGGDSLRLVYLK